MLKISYETGINRRIYAKPSEDDKSIIVFIHAMAVSIEVTLSINETKNLVNKLNSLVKEPMRQS